MCVVARFWIIQKAKLWQIQKIAIQTFLKSKTLRELWQGFLLRMLRLFAAGLQTLSMEIIMQNFPWRVALAGAALLAASAAFPSVSRADSFNLTSCHISNGSDGVDCGTVTQFGTVSLTQSDSSTVHFDVVLNSGNLFVETGAGATSLFLFNDALTGSSITNISATLGGNPVSITGGLSGATNINPSGTPPGVMADGAGNFTARVFCTTTSSCNGASGADIDDLHFDVTNATLAQLEILNDKGNLFVADILCGQTGCPAAPNNTGVIDAVPGPVLGAGLPGLVMACVGLVGLARRRRQKIA